MDQKTADQGWQQLQANIERFLGQSLRSDGRRVEYQPRFFASAPGRSAEQGQPEQPSSRARA